MLFLFPPRSPPLAAKVLVVIIRLRPRLKVLPSSLLPLAHTSFKGVFVFVLPAFKTTKFREEEEAQEEQDNARISFLSRTTSQEKSPTRVWLFLGSANFLRRGFFRRKNLVVAEKKFYVQNTRTKTTKLGVEIAHNMHHKDTYMCLKQTPISHLCPAGNDAALLCVRSREGPRREYQT